MLTSLTYALVGTLAGVLAGLFGIGGGLVIVPALTALWVIQGASLDIAVPMAIASSLGAMLLTSAGSIWAHHRRGSVRWPVVWRLGPATAVGAMMGAWLATQIDGQSLARVFATIVLIIAVPMLRRHCPSPTPSTNTSPGLPQYWSVFGLGIGLLSALAGIGGGSFNVPYLLRNGHRMVDAVGTAAACGWPIALGGVIGFIITGHDLVRWPQAWGYLNGSAMLAIGVFGALAAPLGARLAHQLPAHHLRRLFGLLLCLVALRMAW